MNIAEYICEGLVEPSYKKLLGQMPTVLVIAGYIEDNPPCQILIPRRVKVLTSAGKDM